MLNVSNAFKEKLADGGNLYLTVDVTYADGTTGTWDDEIMYGQNDLVDGASSSSFAIGVAIEKYITLSIDNREEQFIDKDLYGAVLKPSLKLELDDGKVESVRKGTYTVTSPEEYGEIITITAVDDMYKADKDYETSLTLPQSLATLVRDACSKCNIALYSTSMTHGSYIVNEIPDGLTFRNFLAYAAMIECANARIDVNGYLRFVKWDFGQYTETVGAIVGKAIVGEAEVGVAEGISTEYEKIQDFKSSPTFSSDDVVITGVKVTYSDEEYQYGEDGYVISYENKLAQPVEADDDGNKAENADLKQMAEWLGDALIGATFRTMNGDIYADPTIEFGDMAVSYKYVASSNETRVYRTPITDVSFSLADYTTIQTQAEDPIRLSSSYNSVTAQTLIDARQLVEREKTEREKAVERLAERLANSSGLYITVEEQPDGSSIYYMHNKPTLEESDIVWKLTAEAFGISTDGGKTYPYGFTVDGELITRLLYAEGIDADYITTGSILVRGKGHATEIYDYINFSYIGNQTVTSRWTPIEMSGHKIISASLKFINATAGDVDDLEIVSLEYIDDNTGVRTVIRNNSSTTVKCDAEMTYVFEDLEDVVIFQVDMDTQSMFVNTKQFVLDMEGNATFGGCLTAPSGNIGGFYIGDTALYNGTPSMDSDADGVYLGTDGIREVSGTHYIDIDSATLTNGVIGGESLEINEGNITLYASTGSISAYLNGAKLNLYGAGSTSSTLRAEYDYNSVTYYDSYGVQDLFLSGAYLRLYDSGSVIMQLSENALIYYDDGNQTMELSENGLRFYKNGDSHISGCCEMAYDVDESSYYHMTVAVRSTYSSVGLGYYNGKNVDTISSVFSYATANTSSRFTSNALNFGANADLRWYDIYPSYSTDSSVYLSMGTRSSDSAHYVALRGGAFVQGGTLKLVHANGDSELNCHENLNMNGYSVNNTSDVRLKDNIENSTIEALKIINSIDLKAFDRLDTGEHKDIGIIANQLQVVAPELITESTDGVLGIRQSDLIYYAFKAIQEISEKLGLEFDKAQYISTYSDKDKEALVEMVKAATICESEEPSPLPPQAVGGGKKEG